MASKLVWHLPIAYLHIVDPTVRMIPKILILAWHADRKGDVIQDIFIHHLVFIKRPIPIRGSSLRIILVFILFNFSIVKIRLDASMYPVLFEFVGVEELRRN